MDNDMCVGSKFTEESLKSLLEGRAAEVSVAIFFEVRVRTVP